MSAPPREGLLADTLRSLAAPPRAMLIDSALLAAFCACAPALWRALFARELRAT